MRKMIAEYINYRSDLKSKVFGFLEKAMEEMDYKFLPESKDADIAFINEHYINKNGTFILAMLDNEIIGSVGVKKIDQSVSELKRFYVLNSYQGQGIGTSLIDKAINYAKDAGYILMRLDTTFKSKRAIKIFHKKGFNKINRYNQDPYAELFMELEIGKYA